MRFTSFAKVCLLMLASMLAPLPIAAAQPAEEGPGATAEPSPEGFSTSSRASAEIDWPQVESIRDSKERQRRYRAHVEDAVREYRNSSFDEATREYLSAYQIEPEPLLLFNAAQAQRKAQKWAVALALYQLFIQKSPRSAMAPEADANSASMRANLEVDRIARERERLSQQMTEAEEQARRRSEQAEAAARDSTSKLEQENKALNVMLLRVKDSQPVYRKKWFWGVIGGSLAVVAGLAVGLGVALRPEIPEGTLGNVPVSF